MDDADQVLSVRPPLLVDDEVHEVGVDIDVGGAVVVAAVTPAPRWTVTEVRDPERLIERAAKNPENVRADDDRSYP